MKTITNIKGRNVKIYPDDDRFISGKWQEYRITLTADEIKRIYQYVWELGRKSEETAAQ